MWVGIHTDAGPLMHATVTLCSDVASDPSRSGKGAVRWFGAPATNSDAAGVVSAGRSGKHRHIRMKNTPAANVDFSRFTPITAMRAQTRYCPAAESTAAHPDLTRWHCRPLPLPGHSSVSRLTTSTKFRRALSATRPLGPEWARRHRPSGRQKGAPESKHN